jgi:hypothetical protein
MAELPDASSIIDGGEPAWRDELDRLCARGRWVSAIRLLTLQLSASPPSSRAVQVEQLQRRAEGHLIMQEFNAALADSTRILKWDRANVAANCAQVRALLGLRRYEEARAHVRRLTDGRASPLRPESASCSSAASSSTSLDATAHEDAGVYAPLVKLLRTIELEQTGVYDMRALEAECMRAVARDSPRINVECFEQIASEGIYPCVRMGPHADYLHPSVECAVKIARKGRGTRVRRSSSSASLSGTSSANLFATLAPNSPPPAAALPPHTLVMSMKALVTYHPCDELSRDELLMRKLADQPQLIKQVERLFGLIDAEMERAALLDELSATAAWQLTSQSPKRLSGLPLSGWDKTRLKATLLHNPFGDSLGQCWRVRRVGGAGLWFLPSFFNHSCVANCKWTLIGDQIFVRTLTEVQPGEELTIAYTPTLSHSFAVRQAELMQSWRFRCTCALCMLSQRDATLDGRLRQLQRTADEAEECMFELQHDTDESATVFAPRAERFSVLVTQTQRMINVFLEAAGAATLADARDDDSLGPVHACLLKPLEQLCTLLSFVLNKLDPSHPHAQFLLRKHREASRLLIRATARFAGAGSHEHREAVLNALQTHVAHHKNTSVDASQLQMLSDWARDAASSAGDTDVQRLLVRHRTDMLSRGLRVLLLKLEAQLASAESASDNCSSLLPA